MFSILSTTTKCRSWYIVHFRSTRKGKSFGRHIKHSPFNCFGRNWSSFSSICSRHTLKKVEPPKESIPQELNRQANSVESIKVELKKKLKSSEKNESGKIFKVNAEKRRKSGRITRNSIVSIKNSQKFPKGLSNLPDENWKIDPTDRRFMTRRCTLRQTTLKILQMVIKALLHNNHPAKKGTRDEAR